MILRDLVNGIESINHLVGLKLPVAVSFKLGSFIKKMTPELETYNTTKNGILKELAEPVLKEGKETGQYKFKDEKTGKEYIAKMTELEESEVKVEIPEIKIADLGEIEIEPKHLVNITWLISE